MTLATEELMAFWLELDEGGSGAGTKDDDALDEDFNDASEEATGSLPMPELPPPHAVNTKVSDRTDKVLKV